MKKFKNLALICLLLSTTGCELNFLNIVDSTTNSTINSTTTKNSVSDKKVEYLITIKTMANVRVNDVEVNIYDGETLIEKAVTDFIGNVEVELPKKELTVKLTNLPKGMCELEEGYKLNGKGGNVLFQVGSSVIEEKIPSNKKFKLGDIMYDFEFTDTKGNEYSLADTLKTKDLVLINFWYSGCGPCQMEFPNFNLGYEFFSDRVEYFVMSIDPNDTISVIERYMKINNINFPMGRDENNMYDHFDFNNYVPATVLVNKYGIITFLEVGSITSEDVFIELLEENLKF